MTAITKISSGVEVKLSFFPLAFFLFFCTPTVVVDGKSHKLGWGTHFIGLSPGQYTIKVFFGYMFMPECGANSIDVSILDGSINRIKFYMWPWMLAKGSLKEVKR